MSSPTVDEVTYCAKHPEREASLRCIRCDRLMCSQCIVKTPTGYICQDCARRAEDKFFHATNQDYWIQGAACFIGMALAAAIIWQTRIASQLLFSVFIGPVVGGAVAEVALRMTERRRGRYSDRVGTAAAAAGGVLGSFVAAYLYVSNLVNSIVQGNFSGGNYNMQTMMDITQLLGSSTETGAANDFAAMLNSRILPYVLQAVFTDAGFLVFLGLAVGAVYARFQVRI
jgi:hypothetical protein